MTVQHETAIKAARDAYWSEVHHGGGYDDSKPYEAAIAAYLSSIGGVVCQREPVGYATELELKQLKLGATVVDLFRNGVADSSVISLHAPLPIAGKGDDGWNRNMDAAPKDKTPVIIAVLHKDNDAFIVGEAYFDPEHYGDGDWWWAGNSYGDYHGGPISEINYNGPSAWRHLPAPPSLMSEDTEGMV